MGQRLTLKQQVKVRELERLSWNAALEEAKLAVMKTGLYYKDGLSAIYKLHRKKDAE